MNDCGVWINFNFENIFKVCLSWWECDYVLVLWVLMVELRGSLGFWGVLERSIEKVILVKNECPRGGKIFQFWGYFQSYLKVAGM